MDRALKDMMKALDLHAILVENTIENKTVFSTIVGPAKRIYAQFAQVLMPSTGNKLTQKGLAVSQDGLTRWKLLDKDLETPISQFHATNIKAYTLTNYGFYGAIVELA